MAHVPPTVQAPSDSDIFKPMGWVAREKGFSGPGFCSKLERRGPFLFFAAITKQIMPRLVDS